MRPDPGQPYYTAYEKRYRSLYSQGITFWSNFPSEISDIKKAVSKLVDKASPPLNTNVLEFGCGEGFLAEYIVSLGFSYTGIDIAKSALEKAKERNKNLATQVRFILGDITEAACGDGLRYDMGIDVSCLHMLVLDCDRQKYLRNVKQSLVEGAYMLFCREACRRDAPGGVIQTYDQWLDVAKQNVDTLEEREAVEDNQSVLVTISQIAARPRSADQYRQEVQQAGLQYVKTLSQKNSRITFLVKNN